MEDEKGLPRLARSDRARRHVQGRPFAPALFFSDAHTRSHDAASAMGYAGYAPGHQVQIATPLQQLLKLIKNDATLATMEKLTRNTAQAPAEEKFRKIRLTNAKIAEVITNVTGAVEAMVEMGWVKEDDGEFLVLPAGTSVSMREVREIDDARRALKKWEEEELKRRIAARNKANACPEKARLLAEMAADRAEQKARGPVTQGSVAVERSDKALAERMQTAAGAGCCGSSGGG